MPPPMVPEPMTTARVILRVIPSVVEGPGREGGAPPAPPAPSTPLGMTGCLNNRPSSIDHDGVPGDVARRIRSEKHSDAFQLTGIAHAADWIATLDLRLDVLDHRIGEARVKETGGDGVDADSARAPGRGQLAGEADQRGLARDVTGEMRTVRRRP